MKFLVALLFATIAVSFAEECKDIWDDIARENETYCEHYNLPFLDYCNVGKFAVVMMKHCKKTCGYCKVEVAGAEAGEGATEAVVVVAGTGEEAPAEEAATMEEVATMKEVAEAVNEAVEEVVDGMME